MIIIDLGGIFINKLSVCIISKNEEKNITRCINSIKNIADEIILVDTGSTDNTVKLAKDLGAKILFHKWNNDFSEARNVSIENATKDWILFLDCDEEIKEDQGNILKNLILNDNKHEGYYLRLVNIIDETELSDAIVFRLFKNNKDYRFTGKMHEQIINSIQNKHGLECIGATSIRILHYGYDPKVSDVSKKSERNLSILLSYDEKDKDGYYYYVLGNEYARANNFKEALVCYKKSQSLTNIKEYRYIYYPYLVMNIARSLFVEKKYSDEINYLKKSQKELPDFKDLYFMETLLHIECARFTKAKEALTNYTNAKKGQYEYPSNNFENYYNIAKLMYDLDQGIVEKKENLLSVWISLEKDDLNIIDCIKSVNEIAFEVLIITSNYDEINLDPIEQMGAKIIKISKNNLNKKFQIATKNSRAKYILVLNEDNLCSQVSQKQLMYLLKDEDCEGYYVKELDVGDNSITDKFSLFKNTKKFNSMEEYEDNLKEKKNGIIDSKIIIHKK